MKVETDIITSNTVNLIGKTVIMYLQTFKNGIIVSIS